MNTPTLDIRIPAACERESRWTCSVVLERFLGLSVRYASTEGDRIIIERDERSIEMDIPFLQVAHEHWLDAASMPGSDLACWNASKSGLADNLLEPLVPVIAGTPSVNLDDPNRMRFEFDLIGTIFFSLSRYEECVIPDRDEHDRFPAAASLAHQHGFLQRPIVDEYVEILWNAIHRQWPDLQRKHDNPRINMSCDVDHLRDPAAHSLPRLVRRLIALGLGRTNAGTWSSNIRNHLQVRKHGSDRDPYRSAITRMMNDAEERGHHLTFFFIPRTTASLLDGDNRPEDDVTRAIITAIHQRGYEIGAHPGYETYRHPTEFSQSIRHLREQLNELGINHDRLGNRQHYLRWSTEITPGLCDRNAIHYDSSLGYAQCPGFRCGTSRDYPMYDLVPRKPLNTLQRPLVVMDVSLLNRKYHQTGRLNEDLKLVRTLRERCLHYGGNFNALWHNSSFMVPRSESLYATAIG